MNLIDWTNDIKELIRELGIQKFSVIGHSAGGPHALAVALKIKESIVSVATVGGVVLPGSFSESWESPDWKCWSEGMRSQNKMITKLGSLYPEIFKIVWKVFAPTMISSNSLNEICDSEKSEKKLCEKSEFRNMFYESQVESFRQGTLSLFRELRMIQSDWGFHVKDIKGVPVKIWVGKNDQFTTLCMGKYLEKHIDGSVLKVVESGHFSMWSEHTEDILRSVLPNQ